MNPLPWNQGIKAIMSSHVVVCNPSHSLKSAAKRMLATGYRRLPVVKGSSLHGMLTTVDVLSHLLKNGSMNVPVSRVMCDPYTINSGTCIRHTYHLFHVLMRGGYPVMTNGKLEGMITDFDFLSLLGKKSNIKVSEAMTHRPFFISPYTSCLDAAKIMAKSGTRRLLVMDEGKLDGIITPSDIILSSMESRPLKKSIDGVFSTALASVGPNEGISHAAAIMKSKSLGGLPVMEKGKVAGIITERDIMECLRLGR